MDHCDCLKWSGLPMTRTDFHNDQFDRTSPHEKSTKSKREKKNNGNLKYKLMQKTAAVHW